MLLINIVDTTSSVLMMEKKTSLNDHLLKGLLQILLQSIQCLNTSDTNEIEKNNTHKFGWDSEVSQPKRAWTSRNGKHCSFRFVVFDFYSFSLPSNLYYCHRLLLFIWKFHTITERKNAFFMYMSNIRLTYRCFA